MIGELVGESKGKRIVRRVLSSDPVKVEVSFEDSGQMLGVATNGSGLIRRWPGLTDLCTAKAKGEMATQDGDLITWKGAGVGKLLPGGAVSYRGMLFYQTTSQKLARLNNMCGAFEYEVDPSGNTTSKVWEWK